MSEDNPHRSSGKVMLWIPWLLILGGGWWGAERWRAGAEWKANRASGLAPASERRLDSVRLGAIVVHDVSANFSDGMMDDTVLLGMSFLKHLEFTQRENQLILRPL